MQSWDDYYCRGWGIDPEVAREKLDFLRIEQERAESMFNSFDHQDEPLFYTNSLHPLNFSCQCKFCVRMHTITMEDREFLDKMGISWLAATSTTTPITPGIRTASENPSPRKT